MTTTTTQKIPKEPNKHPLDNVSRFKNDPVAYLKEGFEQHGDIFQFNVLRRTLVATNDPAHVQYILQENNRNFKKSPAYEKLGLALGNGLFTSEGEFWLRQRRMAAPAFHKKEIEAYQNIMQEETDQMLNSWRDGDEVNMTTAMTHLTLKIISRALLGLSLDDEVGKKVEAVLPPGLKFLIDRIQQPINLPLWVPTTSHREFNKMMQILKEIINNLISAKEKSGSQDDLLGTLIAARDDEGKGMTYQQLQDEVLTFFMAGHETTAVSAQWGLWLIKNNPEVEQKLMEAIASDDDDYIMAIIHETMRLLSPVWLLGRESIQKDQLGSYHIKPKQTIIFSPYLMHKDPRWWEEPESFKPERWLEGKPNPKYAYYPFGGGPRLCIGNHFALQELRIIFKSMFKHFDIQLQDLSFPGADYTLTLRPVKSIIAQVARR